MTDVLGVVRTMSESLSRVLLNPSFWVGLVITAGVGFWAREREQDRQEDIAILRTALQDVDRALSATEANFDDTQQRALAFSAMEASAQIAAGVQSRRPDSCVGEVAAYVSGYLKVMPAVPMLDVELVRKLRVTFFETANGRLDQC